MSSNILAKARDSRNSPAVLKARVIAIRSRDPNIWIFVYEGIDDVGVYEEWIKKIDERLSFEPVVGSGKDQVLGLRANLRDAQHSLRKRTLYFVDKDFDGLKGHSPGDDLFCTSHYSIENYVICEESLRSILLDELRCADDGDNPSRAVQQFGMSYSEFLTRMREVNLKLFAAKKSATRLASIEDRVHSYVDVKLVNCEKKFTQSGLDLLIPVEAGIPMPITTELEMEFDQLNPRRDYRGKFAYGFFKAWTDLLAQDRRAPTPTLFSQRSPNTKFSPNVITLRSLASRTKVPGELRNFIGRAIKNGGDKGALYRLVERLIDCSNALFWFVRRANK